MLKRITESPYLNLFSGLVLLITSGYEIMMTMDDVLVGVRHGILVFGLIQIVKAIPEIMRGLEEVQEAGDLMKERRSA